jgi:HSP20 family molecular chaperone IbpA
MADLSMTQKGRNQPTTPTTPETTRGGVFFTPRVDIYETDRELTLYADLPGVKSDGVDLRYERGELLLHARVEPRQAQQSFLVNEYEVGDFYRVFTIHESIDAGKISADFKNGVLVVHLPKAEAVQPKQITVRGS